MEQTNIKKNYSSSVSSSNEKLFSASKSRNSATVKLKAVAILGEF